MLKVKSGTLGKELNGLTMGLKKGMSAMTLGARLIRQLNVDRMRECETHQPPRSNTSLDRTMPDMDMAVVTISGCLKVL